MESSSFHCSLFWKQPYGLFSSAHLVSCHRCQDRQHRVDLSSWGSLASQAFSPGQVRMIAVCSQVLFTAAVSTEKRHSWSVLTTA